MGSTLKVHPCKCSSEPVKVKLIAPMSRCEMSPWVPAVSTNRSDAVSDRLGEDSSNSPNDFPPERAVGAFPNEV
jgi:hypothetical protein